MQFQKFSRLFVAPITCIAFFLLPFNNINVYADATNESAFWHGFYVEQITNKINNVGVDIGNAEPTDYGLTTANYVYAQSGITVNDVINYVGQQYEDCTGYVKSYAYDYADKVENVYNKIVDASISSAYKAEKALRVVVDATGNTVVNVSSSNYWNSIYNRWFNNRGYDDIYNNENNNNKVSGSSNGLNYSIAYYGLYPIQSATTITDPVFNGNAYTNVTFGQEITSGRTQPVFICQADGIVYYKVGNGQVYYNYWFSGLSLNTNVNPYRIESHFAPNATSGEGQWVKANFTFKSNNTNGSNESSPVLQPYQVGFINYNGNKVPIYRDKTLNPQDMEINGNGTVTIDNTDYPIFVDTGDLTPDAWIDLLNLVSDDDERTDADYDPWGNPWDTQDDGSALGGFFGNLVKDIQKMFKGVGDKIKEIFQKPIDILSDLVNKIKTALTEFFTFSPDDLNVDVSFDFDILESIWSAFLEQLGLE